MDQAAPELQLLRMLVAAPERGEVDPGNIYIFSGRVGEPLEVMGVPEADGFEMKHLRVLERKGWITLVHRKGSEYRGTLTDAAFRFVEGSSTAETPASLEAMVLEKLYEVTGGDPERKVKFGDLLLFFEQPSEEIALAIRRLKAKQKMATVDPSGSAIIKVFWTEKGLREYSQQLEQDKRGGAVKSPNAAAPGLAYITERRIEELQAIKTEQLDLRRLIQLCVELNWAAHSGCFVAMGALQRTIIHHVPPIFGAKNFETVVAQAPKGSFKKHMAHLLGSMKNAADQVLHLQAGPSAPPVEYGDVDFRSAMNELIQRVIDELS